jgi:hypothetical protein
MVRFGLIFLPGGFCPSAQRHEKRLERFNFEFAFEMPKNAGRNSESTGKLKVSTL